MYEGILSASNNPGRYRVGREGPEVLSGMWCEVRLEARWIGGMVCHSRERSDDGGMVAVECPEGVYDGYYMQLEEGTAGLVTVCGLCTGMHVRVHW
jgi:hypothetical protein